MSHDEDLSAFLAEIQAATAEIAAETRQVAAETAAAQRDGAEAEEAAAQARRSGEHGRDWQTLQQRIDLGRTSLDDIVSGVDPSREAEAVRRTMAERLAEGREVFRSIVDEEEQAGELDELHRAQSELARTLEEARRLGERWV